MVSGQPCPGSPRVVVIGGGATGCAVARDLCLRGFSVTLIEHGDLGSGTSGRFHGLLQSGARYVLGDSEFAAECMRERETVASLAPSAVEPTGGVFVSLREDPPDFADRFLKGCRVAHIPSEEIDPDRVMAEEPAISREVVRAFTVPDAAIHPWRLVNLLADDVRRLGGRVLTRHRVKAIETKGGRLRSVRIAGKGTERVFEVDAAVNAAGPWSARVAALAGGHVDLQLTKGSIVVLAHRLVGRAINRCRPPTSHDIVVPTGTVSLFGTTSEVVSDPDTTQVRPQEVQALLDGAEPLLPGIRGCRALRAWAGVRPLVKPKDWSDGGPLPRRHVVVDHAEEGVEHFFSVCGGSLTTHRSMAEDVSDHVCRRLGINQPCRTTSTPLDAGEAWRPVAEHERAARVRASVLCECEAVDRETIETFTDGTDRGHIHDLRRRLRIGFGPCQGTFCGPRVADLLATIDPGFPVVPALAEFWGERLKGAVHTAWCDQARQIALSDTVYREVLGLVPGAPLEER